MFCEAEIKSYNSETKHTEVCKFSREHRKACNQACLVRERLEYLNTRTDDYK